MLHAARLFLVVSAFTLAAVPATQVCPAAEPVAPSSATGGAPAPIPGLPFTIGRLDSSRFEQKGLFLFVTPEEITIAKERATSDAATESVFQQALKNAGEKRLFKNPPIDESWWQAAKDKPWEQTYPEVFENTMIVPGRYADAASDLAMGWLLTGDDRYLDQASVALRRLAHYSFEPVHYDVGMNYSIWGITALRAFEILRPHLAPEQVRDIDAFMTRFAYAVARNDVYWVENNIGGGINNHLAWHKAALGLLGLYYHRPDMVDYCLNSRRGLVELLADGLLDDGLWCESSLTYQFAAIAPMMLLADCQRRAGNHPALHEIVAPNGRTLKQSWDAMFNVLAPDLLIPPIGDAYGARQKLCNISLYEYGWALWGDPKYAWLMSQNPKPSMYSLIAPPIPSNLAPPPITSRLLPEHGYVFLRSHHDGEYWHHKEARMAFLTYDRSGVHANADKLSLMLFGQGRMLVPDVEGIATVPHAFSSKIQRELNRGGLSQNTVMIDGADQRCMPEMLRLIEYRDLPDEKRATAVDETGILYPGVRQMRTIAMTPEYVLDVFQVNAGDKPRQIDWIAHLLDESGTLPLEHNPALAALEPFRLSKAGAYPWLREAESFKPVSKLELDACGGDGSRLRLQMLNPGFERAIVCGYPANDKPGSGNIPMLIARMQAPRAVFAAIWLIGDAPAAADLEALPDHDGKLVFEVTTNTTTRRHLLPKLNRYPGGHHTGGA